MRTREGKKRVEMTKKFSQRNTRIDEEPAMPDDPKDHALTGGSDESLRWEGGHSPLKLTVVLEDRWSNDEKNREEQSQQQAEEESQHQAREEHSQWQANPTKGLRPRQGEVRGETPHRAKLQSASPEASKNRCRCPAGAIRAESWRSDHGHPKDRLQ